LDPTLGQIFHAGTIGNFTFDVEVGTTKPIIGGTTSPILALTLGASSNAGGGTLFVDFSETGFGPSGSGAIASATGLTSGTVNYQTFQDPANNLFGGIAITATGTGPGPINFSDIGALSTTSPLYSLTQRFTIQHAGAGSTVIGESSLIVQPFVAPVPDGGWAVGLLGFALMGVEGLRRKFTRV
jgi:hypothetical protein